MIGRIVCYFRGHMRGKAVRVVPQDGGRELRVTACPRCGRESERITKTRQQPAQVSA